MHTSTGTNLLCFLLVLAFHIKLQQCEASRDPVKHSLHTHGS